MQKNYWNEVWKPLLVAGISPKEKYLISNHGRVRNIKNGKENPVLVKPSNIAGYPALTLRRESGKSTTRYIHKLVAEHFITKPSEDKKFVLHLDYNKTNNFLNNLLWATKAEKEAHQQENSTWRKSVSKVSYSKLNESKVKLLKMKIHDPNRRTRLKMLAKQFGISEMQLYRIKSGENWGYVKID